MNENEIRRFYSEWEESCPSNIKNIILQTIKKNKRESLSNLKLQCLEESIWEDIIEEVRGEIETETSDSMEDDYEEGKRTTEPSDEELEAVTFPKVSKTLRSLTKVDLLRRVERLVWTDSVDEILSKSDDEIVVEKEADREARETIQALSSDEQSKLIQDWTEEAMHSFNIEVTHGQSVYVYVIRNPDGTPIYVGKGISERAWSHIERAQNTSESSPLLDEIRRIMATGNNVLVDIVDYFEDELEALRFEERLIAKIGQQNTGSGPLLNVLGSGGPHYALSTHPETHRADDQDLHSFIQPYVQELEKLGWHVILDSSEASLHEYFKNGKIRKGATVSIQFFEDSSIRPWYCSAPSIDKARTYKKVESAAKFFLDMGRKYAPGKRR